MHGDSINYTAIQRLLDNSVSALTIPMRSWSWPCKVISQTEFTLLIYSTSWIPRQNLTIAPKKGILIKEQFNLSPSASTIQTCSRNLPEPEPCIIESVNKLRSALAVGDLGGGFKTPPLEPLHIENIDMRRGNEFQAVFSNLLVSGPSKFVMEKLK